MVEGQRLTQAASDIFLGWDRGRGPDGGHHDFYVRQLWDGKFSAQIELMEPEALEVYGEICGVDPRPRPRTLRRPHRHRCLPGRGRFDQAIAEFADPTPI